MYDTSHRFAAAQVEYRSKIRTAAYHSAYVSKHHDVEDMEQELLVVLWESCALYDPARGMTFNSFFWMRAKQKIGMIQDWNNTLKRQGDMQLVSLDEEWFEYTEDDGVNKWINLDRPSTYAPSAEEEALTRLDVQNRMHGTDVERAWREQVERYAAAG